MDEIPKKERLIDLGVILCLGFLPPFAKSIYAYVYGAVPFYDLSGRNFSFFYASLWEATVIIALLHLLRRRHASPAELGIAFRINDLAGALLITAAAYIAHAVYVGSGSFFYFLATGKSLHVTPRNIEFATGGLSALLFVYIIINACFEELLFRGFLMREVESITGKRSMAVAASTLLQSSCHLYQGIYSMTGVAVVFLTLSLFYLRTRRLAPIIISHLLIDLTSVLLLHFTKGAA